MITTILLCIIFFVLGGGLTFLAIAAGIHECAKGGILAAAFYSEKRGRWEVLGSYLTVAGKISKILRSNEAVEKLHYVELEPTPKKSKESLSKRFKVKLGIKRSGKGWRLGKKKSDNFKQSE